MAALLVIGRRKVKFRFVVFIALLVGGAVLIYSLTRPAYAYSTITHSKFQIEESCVSIIIRSETPYNAPAYGKVIFLAADGDLVNNGQPVAILYKESFDEETVNQLYLIQEKIIRYQQKQLLDEVLEADIARIDNELDKIVSEIRALAAERKLALLSAKEIQLRNVLDQKHKLLDMQTEPDSYLARLYDEEAALLAQIKDWVIEIYAPQTGIISFVTDGLENVLGIDSLDKLTLHDFRSIINKGTENYQQGVAKAEHPLFRIIDQHSGWYAVFEKPKNECYYSTGEQVGIKFSESSIVNADVYKIIDDQDRSLVILEASTGFELISSKRTTSLKITRSVEGLTVPDKALAARNGETGVYLIKDDKAVFVRVRVLAVTNGYAVIEPVPGSEPLNLHHKVRVLQ